MIATVIRQLLLLLAALTPSLFQSPLCNMVTRSVRSQFNLSFSAASDDGLHVHWRRGNAQQVTGVVHLMVVGAGEETGVVLAHVVVVAGWNAGGNSGHGGGT